MRVKLSMTTIPSRIHAIAPVVSALLAQTFRFESLTLYLPQLCVRQKVGYVVPDNLNELVQENPRFQIKHIEQDYGPATKIMPLMLETICEQIHSPKECVLVSVDDDVVLEPHAMEELIAGHIRSPQCILGFMGVDSTGRFVHAEHVQYPFCNVESLGGYRGVLYPIDVCTSMFPLLEELHFHHMKELSRPIMDDDHALQMCAQQHNIQRRVVKTTHKCLLNTPETNMVAFLNIRFISNQDGVSGKQPSEDFIEVSRSTTSSFLVNR
jgi:hypothetical protein